MKTTRFVHLHPQKLPEAAGKGKLQVEPWLARSRGAEHHVEALTLSTAWSWANSELPRPRAALQVVRRMQNVL